MSTKYTEFDRAHQISSRQFFFPKSEILMQPRPPIIVKLSQYQDKNFIKSFIKNLPKEVDEMRKKLYSLLKATKQGKKQPYFQLSIDGNLYLVTETSNFPIYGRLMDN